MLPSNFEFIFVQLRPKVPLRLELSPKFLSTSGPNPTRKARPDYNAVPATLSKEVRYFLQCQEIYQQGVLCH